MRTALACALCSLRRGSPDAVVPEPEDESEVTAIDDAVVVGGSAFIAWLCGT